MRKRRFPRKFTDQFKYQIVQLYNSGKSRNELIREYDLTPSSFHRWVRHFSKNGLAVPADIKELELVKLRESNQRLQMENSVLKNIICQLCSNKQ